jgi:hypothetical protein
MPLQGAPRDLTGQNSVSRLTGDAPNNAPLLSSGFPWKTLEDVGRCPWKTLARLTLSLGRREFIMGFMSSKLQSEINVFQGKA